MTPLVAPMFGSAGQLPKYTFAINSVSEAADAGMVDITKSRYDLSTFTGRLQHFTSVTSPLTLLASTSELKAARDLVDGYEAKFPSDRRQGVYLVTRPEAEKYWRARQLVDSSVHPDTGEVITLPFRMSAFVPTNLLVVAGMLMPNPSLAGIVFWQWVNQSLNVAVNYSNANKSVPMNMREVGTAYAAATTSAVAIAVGMSRAVPRLPLTPAAKSILATLVPFVSVASAGIVNISCMRWKEIRDGVGIYIRDKNGNRHKIGDSPIAGQRAVAMTAASRVLTNIPTLILPPLALKYLQRRKLVPSSGPLARAVDLTLIGTSLLVFLPPAIATFPQVADIDPARLEPRFHQLRDDAGARISSVEFNKGL
ncbi:tricarboxylate carrier [Testicularia cyperi]|uniref:Sidoreflexin n=1 Tax=Testicularia cyperi TaxID=1882483 RepID=A0A317XJC0_9BASI|nr:tricarboxylate carrier [Testicularia cyperi]